jgi:hypothetical protein
MEKKLSIAGALVVLVGVVAWAQGSTGSGVTQLVTAFVTTFAFIIFRVAIAIVIAKWAKRLGRDSTAWGLLAGFISPVIIAIILAIAGSKKGAISCTVELDREHREALEKRFQTLGMDLENGIRMVVYKWLDEQTKSAT